MSRQSRRLSVRLRNIALFSITSALAYQHWCWYSDSSITSSLPPSLYSPPSSSSRWWTHEERIAHLTSGTFSSFSSSSVDHSASSCDVKGNPQNQQAATTETDEVVGGGRLIHRPSSHSSGSSSAKRDDRATPLTKAAHSSPSSVEESAKEGVWDVLVVGGGLIGLYTALEAAQRGLRVAVVEAQDLGSGNTSQSPGTAPGPLAYMQRALRQRESAWLTEACRVLRRDRLWSAVTASPPSRSISSLPSSVGISSVHPVVPPPWSAQCVGIVTHHFTDWLELTLSSVLSTLLTYGSGYAYGPSFPWPSRWISATTWEQRMGTEEGKVEKQRDGMVQTTTAMPPFMVPPTASAHAVTPTLEKEGTEGQRMGNSPFPSSPLPHASPSLPINGEEEEEREPVYGVVCSRDTWMDGPHLAIRLARTAEALGVCILTYAPLVSLQWVSHDHSHASLSPLAKKRSDATVGTPNAMETTAEVPEGRRGERGGKPWPSDRAALCPSDVPFATSSLASSTPHFEATVMDLLSPSFSSISSSNVASPASAAVHKVRARCVINCAGAWVEEVRCMLPETAQDPTPQVVDNTKPLQVKSYLVVPRDGIQSQPPRKPHPLEEEIPSSSSSLSSSVLHRFHLDGLQVSPTRYTFSPTLILPWGNDCVLLGPSCSLLPSLPSWRHAYRTHLSSVAAGSVGKKEEANEEAKGKPHQIASRSSRRQWRRALPSCLTPSRRKESEEAHRVHLMQEASTAGIGSSSGIPRTVGIHEKEKTSVPPLCYRMHMADGYAAARLRILHALQASHMYVDPDKVRSCLSSWAPVIRSPGSGKSGAGVEEAFSPSQMARLSHYMFHGYHIGVSKVTRRPSSFSSPVASAAHALSEDEEARERRHGEIEGKCVGVVPLSASPSPLTSVSRRSPLMEAVAGERVDYHFKGRNASTVEDEGEGEGKKQTGFFARLCPTLFSASSFQGDGGEKKKRVEEDHCGEFDPPDAFSSLSYERIPFLHVYGGIPAQARDIAVDALQKALSLSPFMASRDAAGVSPDHPSSHSSWSRGWRWWRSARDDRSDTEGTVGTEGSRGVVPQVVGNPLSEKGGVHRVKPLVLLPLPWETSAETRNGSDAEGCVPTRLLSWFSFLSLRGRGISSFWTHPKAEEENMQRCTSTPPHDTTTLANGADHVEEEKNIPHDDRIGDVTNAVRMMVRYGYAEKVSDVLFRRLRVGYSHPDLAALAARGVAEVMGKELHWSRERVEQEVQEVLEDIESIIVSPRP